MCIRDSDTLLLIHVGVIRPVEETVAVIDDVVRADVVITDRSRRCPQRRRRRINPYYDAVDRQAQRCREVGREPEARGPVADHVTRP